MKDFNQLMLSGSVIGPLSLNQDRVGNSYLTFELESVRTFTNRGGPQEESLILPVVAWGKSAEAVAHGVKAGDTVFFVGKLKQERWVDGRGVNRTELALNVSGFTKIESAGRAN